MTRFFQDAIISQFAEIGVDPRPTDTNGILALRKLLFIAYKFMFTFKGQVKFLEINFVFIQETQVNFF